MTKVPALALSSAQHNGNVPQKFSFVSSCVVSAGRAVYDFCEDWIMIVGHTAFLLIYFGAVTAGLPVTP